MNIKCDQYEIEHDHKVKILGILFTSTLDKTPNVNATIQKVNFRTKDISKFIQNSCQKTRNYCMKV